jgi:hypothetical protein
MTIALIIKRKKPKEKSVKGMVKATNNGFKKVFKSINVMPTTIAVKILGS